VCSPCTCMCVAPLTFFFNSIYVINVNSFVSTTVELHLSGCWLSGSPIIRICLALRLNLSRVLQKLTCLEITGYRIKYSTVLWLLELQISRGRKTLTQVYIVNSSNRTANCHCSLFSKKNQIIWIFCISGWLAAPFNPFKFSSIVPSQLK
jgi:hypothetical protein